MHRRMRAILLACLFVISINLWAQNEIRIRTKTANAREEANKNSTILQKLKQGETYSVVGDVPYWYEIVLKSGQKAFVAKSLCTLLTEGAEGESGDASDQPLGELYALPPPGTKLDLPGCTAADVPADWNVCPVEGAGGANGPANQRKNRLAISCSYTVMSYDQILELKNLPKGVRSLDASDSRSMYLKDMESRPVVVEAYIAMVKSGGEETPNCNSSSRKDVHMELAGNDTEDPKHARDKGVVAEVTPWFAAEFPSWTLDTFAQYSSYRSGFSGTMKRPPTKARIYGWLFFDNWHAGDGSVGTWRGTAWEIHPITRIEVWVNGAWQQLQ